MQKNSPKSAQVWSQTNCPACTEAKRLLDQHGVVIEERMLGVNGYTKKDLIDLVPQARSVPQIFVDGEYVGGLQELKRKLLNDNNKNTSMV
jgi:glutaredoxin 3